jgi:hypothetical protein
MLGKIRSWIGPQRIVKQLPFIYFVGLLTLVYIANVHRAEYKVRKIYNLQKQNQQDYWEYRSYWSEIKNEGIRSETEQRVWDLGLRAPVTAPKVIVVKKGDGQKE